VVSLILILEMFKENVANNIDRVKFKDSMTKWPVQNKHLKQHETRKTEIRNRHKLRKKLFCCCFRMFPF